MIEPSDAERSEWPDATRAYVEALEACMMDISKCERLANALMRMAAQRSIETSFGWSHPDCEVLQGAASTLRGSPRHDEMSNKPVGVLSTCQS